LNASEYVYLLDCALYCRYVLPLLWAWYAVLAVVNVQGFCCSFILCWGILFSTLVRTGGSARRRTGGGRVASRMRAGSGYVVGKGRASGAQVVDGRQVGDRWRAGR